MPLARKRPTLPFEIRESPVQGLGAFATRRIRAGTRIVEYLGERISPEEADTRYDDDEMDRHHTFLFAVDDRTVIDAARGGNEARFINHSCAPNCEAILERRRIFIETLRDIAAGEELFYDYALERDEPWQEIWAEQYACRCGAPACRGTILKPPPPKPAPKPRSRPRRKAAGGRAGAKRARRSERPRAPRTSARRC